MVRQATDVKSEHVRMTPCFREVKNDFFETCSGQVKVLFEKIAFFSNKIRISIEQDLNKTLVVIISSR